MDYTTVSRERWQDHWLFLTHFRKSPRTVGAIAPSSRRLARAMLDGLPLEPGSAVRVVELGPGTGAVTGEIARRLPADAACLAIDVDPVFSARVGARWPRIDSVCDRAERLVEIARARNLLPVDHIVSGLPFASLPVASARAIVDAIVASLRGRRHLHDLSVRSCVWLLIGDGRPRDPDAGNGLGTHTITRPWQPASGIGTPLAEAQIGRRP